MNLEAAEEAADVNDATEKPDVGGDAGDSDGDGEGLGSGDDSPDIARSRSSNNCFMLVAW